MVQQSLNQMKSGERKLTETYGRNSSNYLFSKMIRCGTCGMYYVRNHNMRMNGQNFAS